MLAISQSIKMNLTENNQNIGVLKVSKFIQEISKYKFPFISLEKMELIKIGNGDYNNFDSFIINSLNDYYNKLSNPSDVETKEKMLDDYTKLYSIWSKICLAKENNEVINLQDLYNKISYGLYILGYEDNQL